MRALKKNEKIGIAATGIGVLGVIYLLQPKEDSEGGGIPSFPFPSFLPDTLPDTFPAEDLTGVTKKESFIQEVPKKDFTGFNPFTETVTETSILPSIKDYDTWRESIKRPDPIPVKKSVTTRTPTPIKATTKINPVFDAILTVTDPTLPIAGTAAKLTVEKYVPAKKESIAIAEEIPVSNLTTVIQKSKAENKGFFGMLFSMIKGVSDAKTPQTDGAPFKAKKVDKDDLADVSGWTSEKQPQTGGVPFVAKKFSFADLLNVAGWTTIKKPQTSGAPFKAKKVDKADLADVSGWTWETRRPKFSATAGRYGGAAAGFGKYGEGYTTTKKGGAVVSRESGGWSGGSTRDRMETAGRAGVHGLSYR